MDDLQIATWSHALVYLTHDGNPIAGGHVLDCTRVEMYPTWLKVWLDDGSRLMISSHRVSHIRKVSDVR